MQFSSRHRLTKYRPAKEKNLRQGISYSKTKTKKTVIDRSFIFKTECKVGRWQGVAIGIELLTFYDLPLLFYYNIRQLVSKIIEN